MTRPPPAKPVPLTRPSFLSLVVSSGVGPSARDLVQLLDDLPPDATAAAAAHRLVVRGVLTRFQSDRLLAGRADGLTLGPYLILEPLGQEAGGRTFRARHTVMDRLVCVWVSAADNPRRQVHLEAARKAAKLAHPHVLMVLDVNPVGRATVVTEYVDGAGLDAVVRLAGRLPVGRACDWLRQIALGLAHAHENGVCHGQLTAAAVLVGRPGGGGPEGRMAVKLTGFAGSPADADTVAADLSALGQVGRHLLAGKPGTPPPVLPLELTKLLGELAGRRPPTAAEAADRLTPLADTDFGIVEFDMPAVVPPSESLAVGYLSGIHATPPGESCPFADLLADQPTDAGSITRAERIGGNRLMLTLAGVAACVSLVVVLLVAAML